MNVSKSKTDSSTVVKHLTSMFREVKKFLDVKGHVMVEELMKNPRKDDVTMKFDYNAEGIAINYLKKHLTFPVRVLTEERGEIITRKGNPICTVVIDPVDGSTNYKRNIESTAFSVAVVPSDKSVTPKNVEIALIGSVWSGNVFSAIKHMGAYHNQKRVFGSQVTEVGKALIGMDLDFNMNEKWKWQRITQLTEKCHMIRRGGSASLDAVYVSNGGYDAIVDVRDKSTPENFIAAYLIICEAGGVLTDPFGRELPEMSDISKVYNWVASGNPKLHEQIIKTLNMAR